MYVALCNHLQVWKREWVSEARGPFLETFKSKYIEKEHGSWLANYNILQFVSLTDSFILCKLSPFTLKIEVSIVLDLNYRVFAAECLDRLKGIKDWQTFSRQPQGTQKDLLAGNVDLLTGEVFRKYNEENQPQVMMVRRRSSEDDTIKAAQIWKLDCIHCCKIKWRWQFSSLVLRRLRIPRMDEDVLHQNTGNCMDFLEANPHQSP